MNIPEYESYHEQKSHFDARFPYNTYPCSIPLDFLQVPLHWHDELEFIYIKKGTGVVTVDFTEYAVAQNDIILVLPGQLHGITCPHEASMEYENIIFIPDLLNSSGNDTSYHQFILPLLNRTFASPVIINDTEPAYTLLKRCLDDNDRICSFFPAGYPLAIKGNLYMIFYALFHHYGNRRQADPNHKNMEKIKTIIKYVEIHYPEMIRIEDMANLVSFSESHFMKFFKQTMGQSFTTYLNNYRLTIAARLLLQSDDTILAIATDVGYNNLSYFNRAFKKQYGTTPSSYRSLRRS